jgi:2'-5' RNA ligase
MHLTLRFFGDIDKSLQANAMDIMSQWRPGPLEFSLTRLGTFGRKGSPSVYWLGGEFPREISEIAGRLGTIPDDRGRVETREFTPHLTVARRRGGKVPTIDAPEGFGGVITAAAVINSNLTSGGPVYRVMERYDLDRKER